MSNFLGAYHVLLPAFVLYWTAAADFNFAVGTGAFKELYGMDF